MTTLPNPPAHPVKWRAVRVEYTPGSEPTVEAQSAFVARRELAVRIGCAPEELTLVQVEES